MPEAEKGADEMTSAMSCVQVSAKGGVPDIVQSAAGAEHPNYGGIGKKSSLKLVWEQKDWANIYDCAFFNDGQIAIITFEKDDKGNKKNFQMSAVDLKGQTVDVPFPVFFNKPLAVCGSRDGNTLAISDRETTVKPTQYMIHIYKKRKDRWTTRQITREASINPVTIMPTGEIVCGNSTQVTMFTLDDRVRWEFKLPGKEQKFVPWLTTSQSGLIIVGNANKDDIIVLNAAGQQVQQFPTQFLRLPSSICVDSHDEVLVYDHSNKTISLFTMSGEYIKKMAKADWSPGTVHLYQDKYLLSRNFTKLFLHELV